MTRDRALQISDALAGAGTTHTITVGVHDGYQPRERYSVQVTPVLSYPWTDITALQRIADSLGCVIGYVQGSFVFGEQAQSG